LFFIVIRDGRTAKMPAFLHSTTGRIVFLLLSAMALATASTAKALPATGSLQGSGRHGIVTMRLCTTVGAAPPPAGLALAGRAHFTCAIVSAQRRLESRCGTVSAMGRQPRRICIWRAVA
jgi:hypothetical protein